MSEPIDFKEANSVQLGYETGENLPDVEDLHSYRDETETISCWKLSWKERLICLFTGRIWCRILTYGNPLQPQVITTEFPFVSE